MNKAILSSKILLLLPQSQIINMFLHTTFKVAYINGNKHFAGTAAFSISKQKPEIKNMPGSIAAWHM